MYFGLAISAVLHAALLAWALFTLQSTKELRLPEPEPIAVALITPSELLRMKQGSETAKELESKAKDEPKPDTSKVEAPKPNPILAPTPPAEPPPVAEPEKPKEAAPAEPPKPDPIAEKMKEPPPPEPAPGPTPEELKKQADEKQKAEEAKKKAEADKKKAEDKKKADAKKKEDEKKKQVSAADRLAALLNKDPTKKGAPNSAIPPTKPTENTGPTAGTKTGTDSVLSVREQDLLRGMLRTQIANCWRLPGAGGGTETPILTLRWKMRPDGTLDGEPRVDKPAAGPLAGLATEAAIRAVKGCQPYDLPKDLYATGWKEIIWEFDPSQML